VSTCPTSSTPSTSSRAGLRTIEQDLSWLESCEHGDLEDQRLAALGEQVRAWLRSARPEASAAIVRKLEAVYLIDDLRDQLANRALFSRFETVSAINESMESLSETGSARELIAAAPGELCRACGFTRALISTVRGSVFVPLVYETVPGTPAELDLFAQWLAEGEIPLHHTMPEMALVRRRAPGVLVDSPPASGEHAAAPAGTAYVAAPIFSENRVMGLLHGDRYGQRRSVSVEDRDNISAFAEMFGLLFDRTVLDLRLAAQQEQLREALDATDAVIGELRSAGIQLDHGTRHTPGAGSATGILPSQSRIDALLTRREREVLDLICGGATNGRIAEQLVISEGTVKSHVKHALRKLHANNRAEAVARYLKLVTLERQRTVA
jgi:DNA-binding CsgD family transcriptional regulator